MDLGEGLDVVRVGLYLGVDLYVVRGGLICS